MRRQIGGAQNDDEDDNEINLTPMLDVVFIMLIFFIVTASFVRESGIDVNKPDAPQEQNDDDDAGIIIVITATDEVYIDRRQIDRRAIRANIERLHAEKPDGAVIIQASNNSTNNMLVEVMNASRLAGVYNVSIAEGF